ncbi:MAG: RHS repeat-associated core domain-containing protein, partial [Myxococcota bacterium]
MYDSVGRRVQVINDARGQQDLRYAQGRLDRRTQGSETWTYEYDSAGRHTAAVLPDGTRREIAYDSAAPFGEGQVARMQMVRPGGAVESARTYSYDALGHLLGETLEVSGRTFAMGYSHRNDGELEQVTYPDGSQLSIRHDQAGNMTALDVEETENGQTFSTRYVGLSGYSALGQPGQLEFSNGVTTRYDYDGVGRLARVRTSSQSGDFVDKEYTWNGFGEVAQIEDKLRASFTQTFSFNDVGYLTRAEGAYGVRTYQYDDHGNLTDKAGTQLTYQGDRLLSASNGDTFEYDIRGNRTAKQTAEGTLRYRYSRLDQLKEVVREVRGATCAEDPSVPCEDITQTVLDANVYDANGARIMKTDRNGAVSIYVSPLYEVTTFTNGTELHTRYLNGPAGRIVSITDEVAPSGAGTQTALGAPFLPRKTLQLALIALCLTLAIALAWSWLRAAGETSLSGRARGFVAAMLRTVGLIGEATETQWQVARGTEFMRRRRRLGAASPLVAVYMAFAVTGCQGPLGDPISKVRGGAHGVERLPGGMIVGSTSRALLPGENGDGYPVAGTHFFHPDHLGSSTYVTDAHGHKVAETVYAPYGEVFEPASTGVDVFRSKFSGKEWDAGAELYYFEARHYDAYVGRFIQADIMLLGSDGALASDLNRYAYAANNPVVYTDPSGREVITLVAIGIAALVGATVSVAAYAATNHDDLSWQGFLIAAAAGFVAGAFGGAGGAAAATIGTASVSATAAGVAVVVAYSAAGGFAGSIVQQGFTNLTEGEDFGNIDWAEAGITAGIDGATAGLVSVPSGRFAKLVSKRWSLEAQRWNESLETARKYYKELPSGVKRTADRHKTLFNG